MGWSRSFGNNGGRRKVDNRPTGATPRMMMDQAATRTQRRSGDLDREEGSDADGVDARAAGGAGDRVRVAGGGPGAGSPGGRIPGQGGDDLEPRLLLGAHPATGI